MKHLALVALLAALSAPVAVVQAAQTRHTATAGHAAKKSSAPKAAAKPAATKSASAAKARDTKTRGAKNTKAPASAAAPTETLTPEELEIAKRVYVGKIDCELGASVLVAADETRAGFFNITAGKRTFSMRPVPSRTGAVRMEDGKHEAVFLQLLSKSMLMDQKAGRRMADECQSPEQVAFAAQMKDHPPPNFLDAPKNEPPPAPQEPAPAASEPERASQQW